MKAIWKYSFDLNTTEYAFQIPQGAKPLHVREQRGTMCMWLLVDTEKPKERRIFVIQGTGHELSIDTDKAVYIGTAFMDSGNFVFHIFEVLK